MKNQIIALYIFVLSFSVSVAQNKKIEIVVHRGANALAPENTLPSADSALVHGADWIEVDVRTSKDGVMFNLHDDILDRTTNGTGYIYDRDSAYIATLDAGKWFDKKFEGLGVPTIATMLDGLKNRALVYFDVKDCNLEYLVNLVREKGFTNKSFFWFGKEEMLKEFVKLAPEMKIKVNASDTARLEYWKTICKPSIVEIHAEKITKQFIEYCRRNSIKIMVGAQGESIEDYKKAIKSGADMINLDKPELFEKIKPKDKSCVINVTKFGAVADGKTLNTRAIQQAIDYASTQKNGGIVYLGEGQWLTGQLEMKSNVMLFLGYNATILGSTNPFDYNVAQTENGKRGDENVRQGLIVSDKAKNIALLGYGTIDGQGLELALNIDSLHHIGKLIDPNYNSRRMRPTTRPKLFYFSESENIVVTGLTLRNSSGWGLSMHKCCNIRIDNNIVYNRAYWNNDGIDLDDCQNALITHCDINSADDGICLKSEDSESCCENIRIHNCRIATSSNAIKFGSSSYGGFKNVAINDIYVYDTFRSAVALEAVDGGTLENVLVDGITSRNTGNPFFICLGARHINEHKTSSEGYSQVKNIAIRNIDAQVPFGRPDINYDLRGPEVNYFHNPWPSSIAGLPGQYIENVSLENICIQYPGRATKAMAYIGLYRVKEVNEAEKEYPEYTMYGELPSWAFYVRHVKNISMKNINVSLVDEDFRPAFVFDDVIGLKLQDINQPDEQIFKIDTHF